MNVGILTFQNSNNFGAILQAYALEKKIEEYEKQCTIINYISPTKKGWYQPFNFSAKKGLKHNIKQILKIPNYRFIKEKNRRADRFKATKMNIGETIFLGKSNGLEKYLDNFDIIFVGSDQVWNYKNTSFDKVYFLDFDNLNAKRVSYAASFGMSSIPKNIEEEIKELLSGFQSISVREESGKKMIDSLIDIEAKITLDPTLLHNKVAWENFLPTIQKSNSCEDYLLVYTIGKDINIDKIANEISQKYNLTIVKVMNDFRDNFNSSFKGINPSVEDFLFAINNAKYILTNSFHGVAFSINFNKDFFVCLNPKNQANTRIENLLTITDLMDRILVTKVDLNKMSEIDYKKVNRIIQNKREDSCLYIENQILGKGM